MHVAQSSVLLLQVDCLPVCLSVRDVHVSWSSYRLGSVDSNYGTRIISTGSSLLGAPTLADQVQWENSQISRRIAVGGFLTEKNYNISETGQGKKVTIND